MEGNSIRAISRMTGVARNTVTKLLLDLAAACAAYSDEHLVNLPCKRLQVDEIWEFCYAKAKNVPADKKGTFGYGDVWTFVAIDAATKLVPAWLVGSRDTGSATALLQDLQPRLAGCAQLTTDGLKAYLSGVEDAFGGDVGLRHAEQDLRQRAHGAGDALLPPSASAARSGGFRAIRTPST